MHRALLLAACLLASAPFVGAVEVFRCTAADGSIIYQDRPCANDQAQQSIQLPDDPAPAPSIPEAEPATDSSLPPTEAAPGPPVAVVTGPEFMLCTRADGTRYISEDGRGGGSAVPYGMVGGSGKGLAEVYGGRNGAGVSAPGLREIPRIPAGDRPLAGAQVWIEDECHHAGPREACAWLGSQLDQVAKKLDHAFSDAAPGLKQEQAALRERMRGCGRGDGRRLCRRRPQSHEKQRLSPPTSTGCCRGSVGWTSSRSGNRAESIRLKPLPTGPGWLPRTCGETSFPIEGRAESMGFGPSTARVLPRNVVGTSVRPGSPEIIGLSPPTQGFQSADSALIPALITTGGATAAARADVRVPAAIAWSAGHRRNP